MLHCGVTFKLVSVAELRNHGAIRCMGARMRRLVVVLLAALGAALALPAMAKPPLSAFSGYPENNGMVISPDGKRVAYAWMNKEWFYELRLIGFDGSAARVLYRDPGMRDVRPVDWSADGKQILALCCREVADWTADDIPQQIVWVSVADGSVRVIKTLQHGRPRKLSLSPDGRTIAHDFPIRAGAPERQIRLLATDGSGETPLVPRPANDFFPVWAPDGRHLVFRGERRWGKGLFVVDTVTGTIRAIVSGVDVTTPQWSPALGEGAPGARQE